MQILKTSKAYHKKTIINIKQKAYKMEILEYKLDRDRKGRDKNMRDHMENSSIKFIIRIMLKIKMAILGIPM